MKPILIYNHWIPKKLAVNAITLYPFILFADNEWFGSDIVTHEMEHIKQIEKVGVIRFYISYLLFYAAYRVQGKDPDAAYRYIPYEREAYK